ncbi:MAG: cytochrome c-type biogenesis CcmF C-terminal domain-containing protein [Microthrixaceae bacterium]
MNRAFGLAGVVVALVGALAGIITIITGLQGGDRRRLRDARGWAAVVALGALVAFAAMERALITRDFTVEYVAEHGSSSTPPLFNFATLWSALEGSILLWVLILSGYLFAVAHRFRKRLEDPLVAWALLTIFAVSAFFSVMLLTAANPFGQFSPPPGFDGPGPNPLLQNHVLVAFHPPMLYLGYVGFVVPFAFAVGSLASGRLGEGWLMETRRWTLFAWGFLTAGIVLGGWWSYEVLGWGGYWGWDPVENASLLPWLTGTAYVHSVMVQERHGMLRVWNISLLCATFSLTILGTFLTRSGVVQSVHAFASGAVGPMLLGLFAVVVAVSLGLIAWRADDLRSVGRISTPLSREGAFLANNVVFAALAFVVLLGTVFPLLLEALNNDRVSVGVPYFSRMTMPLGFALLTLMAVAPVMPWRRATADTLKERLFWPAWAGVAVIAIAALLGARLGCPAGIRPGSLRRWFGGAPAVGIGSPSEFARVRRAHQRRNGGASGHDPDRGRLCRLDDLPDDHGGDPRQGRGPRCGWSHRRVHRDLGQGTDRVMSVGAQVKVDGDRVFEPRLNRYRSSGMVIGTPSVRVGPFEDVYLALVSSPEASVGSTQPESSVQDDLQEGVAGADEVTLRVVVQPLVSWIWLGGIVMVLGTALALVPARGRSSGGSGTDDPGAQGLQNAGAGPAADPDPPTDSDDLEVTR